MKLGDFGELARSIVREVTCRFAAGISKILDSKQSFAKTCIGTPYYMSEQLSFKLSFKFQSVFWIPV